MMQFFLIGHVVFVCFSSRNGRWRSQWSVTFPDNGGIAELTGILKVQVCIVLRKKNFLPVSRIPVSSL